MHLILTIAVALVTPVLVKGDYECLCSYKVEMPVNSQANRDSPTIGELYEFDCKPTVKIDGGPPQNWQTIAYEQQLGYVFLDSQVTPQICPGKASPIDLLTTQPYVSTTSTLTTRTTRSTTPPTSTSTTHTTTKPTTQTTQMTTTLTPSTKTSTTIPTTKPTTSTSTTTATTTVSTTKTTTTTTITTPTTTSTTTTHKVTTTLPPVTLGDVRLCPHTLHQYTIEDQGALAQFGNSCYQIVPIRTTWLRAEKDCVAKGGHLFHVSNQREQDFILLFINSNKFAHACWMGFHDLISEENFEWTSGDNVTYTNWWHDRKGNFFSHHTEDCVLFVPFSPYFGKWDDVPCGSTSTFGIDQGQINPFICQFSIHANYTYVSLSSAFGKRHEHVIDG